MDRKSFIFGVACGAFVVVTAIWLLDGNSEVAVTADPGQTVKSANIPDVIRPNTTTPTNQNTPELATQDIPEPPIADSSSSNSESSWPASSREDFETEPRDESWAYYMEQSMLQFLGSHSSIAQFDIRSIDCRTTRCQIEVVGYDESTGPVWQQVMYDIRQQPWSEFGVSGSSWGMIDGQFTIVGTFNRVLEND